ncbi:MAG: hypothetical protein JKY00_07000 [Roseicyclus sp.]|nr:hypothetical protein [Roseicyclus sp.]
MAAVLEKGVPANETNCHVKPFLKGTAPNWVWELHMGVKMRTYAISLMIYTGLALGMSAGIAFMAAV